MKWPVVAVLSRKYEDQEQTRRSAGLLYPERIMVTVYCLPGRCCAGAVSNSSHVPSCHSIVATSISSHALCISTLFFAVCMLPLGSITLTSYSQKCRLHPNKHRQYNVSMFINYWIYILSIMFPLCLAPLTSFFVQDLRTSWFFHSPRFSNKLPQRKERVCYESSDPHFDVANCFLPKRNVFQIICTNSLPQQE